MAEFLLQCRLRVINSINDAEIQAAVSALGYTPERLETGKVLLTQSTALYESISKEYGDLEAAFARRNQQREKLELVFKNHLAVAKIVFKNDHAAITALKLTGSAPSTFSGWVSRVSTFYNNLLASRSWVSGMASFNISEEALNATLQEVIKLDADANRIMLEKGDAQNAVKQRDALFEDLYEWVNDYESIARLALAAKPQLLEKLGIVVPS